MDADRLTTILEKANHPPRWAMRHVLAQDDWGDLYLICPRPKRHGHRCDPDEPWYCRSYNSRNPRHWRHMALTLLTGWVVFVEGGG